MVAAFTAAALPGTLAVVDSGAARKSGTVFIP